jgi:hypothetical protein
MSETVSIYRGDAVTFDLEVTLGGSAVNLNDYLAFWTVKGKLTDPDSKAFIRKNSDSLPDPSSGVGGITVTDAAAGKMSVTLYHKDTRSLLSGTYHYGVNIVEKGSNDALVYTLMEGNLVVELDVGIRVTGDPTA